MNGFERKRKWFFALVRELGFDIEEARDRACKKFDIESFSMIQEYMLDFLIDKLLKVKNKRAYDQI